MCAIFFLEVIMSLEQKIGYEFKNKELLNIALTHTSYAHEVKDKRNNESNKVVT